MSCASSRAPKSSRQGMPLSVSTWGSRPTWPYSSSQKFKTRHATVRFSDKANLHDGNVWATFYALKELRPLRDKLGAGGPCGATVNWRYLR